MHARAYSVTDKLPYHRVAARLNILLHRAANITNPVTGKRLSNAGEQALSGCVHQVLRLTAHISAGERPRVVAVEALQKGSDVNADDISLL